MNIKEITKIAIDSNQNLLVSGETGVGKTRGIETALQENNIDYIRFNINGETTTEDLIGGIRIKNGDTYWQDGVVLTAMKKGKPILLDEINMAQAEVLACLNSVLEDPSQSYDGSKGKRITAENGFLVLATCNLGYEGTMTFNKALLERFGIRFELIITENDMLNGLAQLTTNKDMLNIVMSRWALDKNKIRDAYAYLKLLIAGVPQEKANILTGGIIDEQVELTNFVDLLKDYDKKIGELKDLGKTVETQRGIVKDLDKTINEKRVEVNSIQNEINKNSKLVAQINAIKQLS